MENKCEKIKVDPNGFCRFFDRCDTSLIEEPETCDVCSHYNDSDSSCDNFGRE